jgi:hypothetical protein
VPLSLYQPVRRELLIGQGIEAGHHNAVPGRSRKCCTKATAAALGRVAILPQQYAPWRGPVAGQELRD